MGQAFEGLDANLLAAEILSEIDLNFDLCDVVENEVTVPSDQPQYARSESGVLGANSQ